MEVKGILSSLKTLLTGDRKVRVVVALGILGMLLVLASQCMATPTKEAPAHEDGLMSSEAYTQAMEKKLTSLIGSMEGVGKARVLITLESSAQMIYATEGKTQSDRTQERSGEDKDKVQTSENNQSSYVLLDLGSGQKQPILTSRIEPAIQGVVVVCAGGASKVVNAQIVEVVTTALGVGASRVCVVKGGS